MAVLRVADGSTAWVLADSIFGVSPESYLAGPAFDGDLIYLPSSKAIYAMRKQ
jgi:hypothetical protein